MESRPVAGGSNQRLTRQAIGPSLEMRTDWPPPCVCDLSSCTATPGRRETAQPGTGSAAVAGRSKPGCPTPATASGVRSAAARQPKLANVRRQGRCGRRRDRDLRAG